MYAKQHDSAVLRRRFKAIFHDEVTLTVQTAYASRAYLKLPDVELRSQSLAPFQKLFVRRWVFFCLGGSVMLAQTCLSLPLKRKTHFEPFVFSQHRNNADQRNLKTTFLSSLFWLAQFLRQPPRSRSSNWSGISNICSYLAISGPGILYVSRVQRNCRPDRR